MLLLWNHFEIACSDCSSGLGFHVTGNEAKLANAASIEQYGKLLKSKGLHARAAWAFGQAAKIRSELISMTPVALAA